MSRSQKRAVRKSKAGHGWGGMTRGERRKSKRLFPGLWGK